jgi:hypothetical protein
MQMNNRITRAIKAAATELFCRQTNITQLVEDSTKGLKKRGFARV